MAKLSLLWAAAGVAVLIICAAEPDLTTKALAAVLSALGAWPLWAVTRVRDHAHQVAVRMLDHRAQSDHQVAHQEEMQEDEDEDAAGGGEGEGKGEVVGVVGAAERREQTLALEQGSWVGITLLSRLLYLLLALAIVLGLVSLDFLRAALVTLGIAAAVPLVPPAAAMGLLFVALPAL